MSTGHILVIGAASIDTKGRAGKAIQTGTSTPGAIRVSVGGVGRNIAENLARLGERVVLLSAVGDDGSGRRILQQAAECGIDISHVLVDAEHRTAAYLAVLDDRGDLVMSIDDMAINRELITPGYHLPAARPVSRRADGRPGCQPVAGLPQHHFEAGSQLRCAGLRRPDDGHPGPTPVPPPAGADAGGAQRCRGRRPCAAFRSPTGRAPWSPPKSWWPWASRSPS